MAGIFNMPIKSPESAKEDTTLQTDIDLESKEEPSDFLKIQSLISPLLQKLTDFEEFKK